MAGLASRRRARRAEQEAQRLRQRRSSRFGPAESSAGPATPRPAAQAQPEVQPTPWPEYGGITDAEVEARYGAEPGSAGPANEQIQSEATRRAERALRFGEEIDRDSAIQSARLDILHGTDLPSVDWYRREFGRPGADEAEPAGSPGPGRVRRMLRGASHGALGLHREGTTGNRYTRGGSSYKRVGQGEQSRFMRLPEGEAVPGHTPSGGLQDRWRRRRRGNARTGGTPARGY